MEATALNSLVNPGVRNLAPYVPGKPIEELERELGIRDIVKLASNENAFGPSPQAVDAGKKAMEDVWLYPDASGFRLKQKLAQRLDVRADQITLGNGSNDILVLVAQAFLNASLNAVFSQYCFAVYPIATQMVGATAKIAPAVSADDPLMPLGHDLEAMASRVDENTRIVFVANPNNPTGTSVAMADLLDFVRDLPDHTIVVVDEAYFEYQPEDTPTAIGWLPECPRLLVTRSFSKAFGLAGLRVGYAVSSPAISEILNRARQPFNVGLPGLAAAEVALDDVAHIERTRRENAAQRKLVANELHRLGYSVIPSAANFVLAHFGTHADAVFEYLLRNGIIVRPVANYGLPQYLRISIGTAVQNEKLLAVLGTFEA